MDKAKEIERLVKKGYSYTSALALVRDPAYCKKREEELQKKEAN